MQTSAQQLRPEATTSDARIDCATANAALEPLSALERIRWAVDTLVRRRRAAVEHAEDGGGADAPLSSPRPRQRDPVRRHRVPLPRDVEDAGRVHAALSIEHRDAVPGVDDRRAGEPFTGPSCSPPSPVSPNAAGCEKRRRCSRTWRRSARPSLVNGLRRAEGGKRGQLKPFAEDPRTGGHQLSPIFDWSGDDVSAYIAEHNLLVHPLHDAGYPSIGCDPCTTPVAPGEDARAGRWRHLRVLSPESAPSYCRINFTDGGGI